MKQNESGQAVFEYIIMLVIIAISFFWIYSQFKKSKLDAGINRLITEQYRAAYQYGHPKAKMEGDDPGSAQYHPWIRGEKGDRAFLNPSQVGGP